MSQKLRNEVFQVFKALHRARKSVFNGDERALEAGRQKINAEFKKYKNVNSEESVKELVQLANDVEKELRANVIQAVQVAPDKYQLKITADTAKFDSAPFKECSNANN